MPARYRSTDRLEVIPTALPEVVLFRPRRMADGRGFFVEAWNRRTYAEAGLDIDFVQDNLSHSARPFTVRGLHYQSPPAQQTKLVSVARGRVADAVVDARRGSPTFGRAVTIELSAENGLQILAPRGFLHGMVTLEPDTVATYKTDAHYSGPHDGAVAWNDPDLAIDWGVDPARVVISDKDAGAPLWRDWTSPFSVGEAA
ncbi:dTDP-4-dehydrorhamnose 3,5-epimerase [Caulobacter sp. 17J80-11]|uniref:dTDP-4-dehydrorhamnose 3,5-epimerase n=1 Tax=Caulobacter sp. 17J80-11 TaxID=2763502 RepID=UPI00165396B4|nr:dTDP-4-dehydrorhamnose 3,5-epimerase [Caulobacter sp. 17J80-11]MBC6983658.1 dTDP-4-dehydrorhamnose 3,5-epimerase [Caulobacter sp. 17J80-11]